MVLVLTYFGSPLPGHAMKTNCKGFQIVDTVKHFRLLIQRYAQFRVFRRVCD